MKEVTFSVIPEGREFVWHGKRYLKLNMLGISGMVCNAEALNAGRGNNKHVCMAFHELVETDDDTLPAPTFKVGQEVSCIKQSTADVDKGKTYTVACNSYYYKGQECLKVKRKAWEMDLPIPVEVFGAKETNDVEQISGKSRECSHDSQVDERAGRRGDLEQCESVKSGANVDDSAEQRGWDAEDGETELAGGSDYPQDYFPGRTGDHRR